MPRLIWTPEALADVQRLWRFLATKSVDAAGRAAHAIREGARTIAIQPEAGRPMADMEPEFREWPVPFGDSGYVVLYRYDGKTALIVAVRHQREIGY